MIYIKNQKQTKQLQTNQACYPPLSNPMIKSNNKDNNNPIPPTAPPFPPFPPFPFPLPSPLCLTTKSPKIHTYYN